MAFDEAEFGVYDGPDEDGRGGGGPVEFEGVVKEAVAELEVAAEVREVSEPAAPQKSREEWLTAAGLELPENPADKVAGDYISGLGEPESRAVVGGGANGTREPGAESGGEKLARGNGHAWAVAVPDAGGDTGGSEATRGGDELVGGAD